MPLCSTRYYRGREVATGGQHSCDLAVAETAHVLAAPLQGSAVIVFDRADPVLATEVDLLLWICPIGADPSTWIWLSGSAARKAAIRPVSRFPPQC
jgi:hypothetical protein